MYVDALSKEDKLLVKDKHLKELIKLGINKFAIATNNIELLQYLIENNFITNDEALIIASRIGHIDVIKYLVDNGADIHAYEDYALIYASKYDHVEVVTLLLAKSGPEA